MPSRCAHAHTPWMCLHRLGAAQIPAESCGKVRGRGLPRRRGRSLAPSRPRSGLAPLRAARGEPDPAGRGGGPEGLAQRSSPAARPAAREGLPGRPCSEEGAPRSPLRAPGPSPAQPAARRHGPARPGPSSAGPRPAAKPARPPRETAPRHQGSPRRGPPASPPPPGEAARGRDSRARSPRPGAGRRGRGGLPGREGGGIGVATGQQQDPRCSLLPKKTKSCPTVASCLFHWKVALDPTPR